MNDFETYFNEKIQPHIERTKGEFLKIKLLFYFCFIFFIPCTVILFAPSFAIHFLSEFMFKVNEILFFLLLFGIILSFILAELVGVNLKEKTMPGLAKLINPNLTYSQERYLPRTLLSGAKFLKIKPRHEYDGEDFFEGVVDGVKISFSKITITEKNNDSKGKLRKRVIFNGHVYCFDFRHQKFEGTTVILPKHSTFSIKGLEKVKLRPSAMYDYSPIGQQFSVFTSNEKMLRGILTPHAMNTLIEFSQKERKKVRFAFKHGRLLIALPTIYDPFTFKPYTTLNEKTFRKLFNDARKPIELMKQLKLNGRF